MKLKILSLALAGTTLLSGCSYNDIPEGQICFSDTGEVIDCVDMALELSGSAMPMESTHSPERLKDPTLFKSNINFVLLNEYVEQMAIEMKSKLNQSMNSSVAVSSFVKLDSSLQNTSFVGNQLSEYFISELKGVGIPVSDHKVTGMIQVSPKGDFAMSRKVYELKNQFNVGYVLTGTLIENERGMVVNARIVSLSTNRVVTATSKLIPHLVLQ